MLHIPVMDVFWATMSPSTAHFGMIQGFCQEPCRKKKMKPSSKFIMTGASGTLWKHTFYRWIIAHKPCRWQQHTRFNWIIINILVVCSSVNMYDSTSWGLKDVTHTYSLQRHTTRFRSSMMTSSNGNIFPGYWPFVRGIHRLPVNWPHRGQ